MTSPEKLTVIVVDDEAPARGILREYLEARPDVEVVAECANGFEAVKAAGEHSPDLVFLDVQMPKLDGFEVLELLDPRPAVVFVTAYDEYAIRAFEVHAVDYLLKPFTAERLDDAVDRARQRRAATDVRPAELARAARPAATYLERVLIKQGARIDVVPTRKVDYFEARDDHVLVRTEGRELLKQQTLTELEMALDPSRFVRVHRSYVLNVERLAKIEVYAKDSRRAILADGAKIPISRAGYARLRELL